MKNRIPLTGFSLSVVGFQLAVSVVPRHENEKPRTDNREPDNGRRRNRAVNKDELEKTEAQKRSWEAGALKKTLDRAPERQAGFATTSGIPLERVYTPLDAADQDYGRDLGFPGEYPFTRGVQPTMYRGRFWTMRQYAGFGTA